MAATSSAIVAGSPISSFKTLKFLTTTTTKTFSFPLRNRNFPSPPLPSSNKKKSTTRAIHAGRKGLWSIREDLQTPSSPYFPAWAQGDQGPPSMVQERFQSVIGQLFQHRIIRCGGAVDDDMTNIFTHTVRHSGVYLVLRMTRPSLEIGMVITEDLVPVRVILVVTRLAFQLSFNHHSGDLQDLILCFYCYVLCIPSNQEDNKHAS